MDIKDILSKVDHTLLNPKATWEEIKNICGKVAMKHGDGETERISNK